MRRDRFENRRSESRSPYGEHPDSLGYEEYHGSNKRRPWLGRKLKEPYPSYYGNSAGDREEFYRHGPEHSYQGVNALEQERYPDERPLQRQERGENTGRRKGRESLRGSRQGENRNDMVRIRGQLYGMNSSENYGRRNEAALYDDESPERSSSYRGRGFFTREHEGEYEQGVRAYIGNIRGFGRHDDERNYTRLGYRNMSTGFLDRSERDERHYRRANRDEDENWFSDRHNRESYGSERYGDGGGYSERRRNDRNSARYEERDF